AKYLLLALKIPIVSNCILDDQSDLGCVFICPLGLLIEDPTFANALSRPHPKRDPGASMATQQSSLFGIQHYSYG
ncbi:1494_t:CDS:1, partial [Acaulospora colombiana]